MVWNTDVAYEVNPADSTDIRGPHRRGNPWNPVFSDQPRVETLADVDPVNYLYEGRPDANPPPNPGGAYRQVLNPVLRGPEQQPTTYVEEVVTWELRSIDEVMAQKEGELAAHAVGTDEDPTSGILYDECRLTGLGGNDFWVPMGPINQAVDNGHDARINRLGWPPNGIRKRLTNVDTNSRRNVDITEEQWDTYVRDRDDFFLDPLERAYGKVSERLQIEYDAGDVVALEAVDVKIRWSPAAPATWVDGRTFSISGDQTAFFSRGYEVECRQTVWLWGRVESASHAGGTTTVVLDFRDGQTLVNEAFDVSVDLWGYPEWRSWVPGQNASDPEQAPGS